MFVWNGIDHRMVDAMKLTAILSITGAVIRAADHKSAAPPLFPSGKQPAQFPIHIPQGCPMAGRTVTGSAFQIKIVGIMDGIHIQIEKNMLRLCMFYLP